MPCHGVNLPCAWRCVDSAAIDRRLKYILGDRHENGDWSPHLHLQLCTRAPLVCDLPGVVSAADREEARQLYPDPRLVLGPIY
jgi:hypothetical protein